MSKLLINERPLLILPKLATVIGLNEAIVLQQIHYWLLTYAEKHDVKHFREGRWWVWNSIQQWQSDNFPFWDERTVRRVLTSLRNPFTPKDRGGTQTDIRVTRGRLVLTGNFNEVKYDKTIWYTIDYTELNRIENQLSNDLPYGQNVHMDVDKMSTPIP